MSVTPTVPMSDDVARICAAATAEERQKIELMLRLGLGEFIARPKSVDSLLASMDELGRQAAANGLTEEILAEILRDDD